MSRAIIRRTATTRLVGRGALALGLGLGFTGLAALPAAHADETFTQTFGPGGQSSFAVPADATSLRVTAAGQQGSSRLLNAPGAGGAGGTVTVDLGTAYNGQTLNVLVGNVAYRQGSGASFIATDSEFLVVAGAGGSGGIAQHMDGTGNVPLRGGAGGFASGGPGGGDGEQYLPTLHHSGLGAIGVTPGAWGYNTNESGPTETPGTVAAVLDGTIIPGLPTEQESGGYGGQGYAAGGNSSDQLVPAEGVLIRGASGGGSGYVAPGLAVLSTAANENALDESPAAAYVSFTWTVAVADPAPESDDDPPPGERAGLVSTGSAPSVVFAAAGALLAGGVVFVVLGVRVRRTRTSR